MINKEIEKDNLLEELTQYWVEEENINISEFLKLWRLYRDSNLFK